MQDLITWSGFHHLEPISILNVKLSKKHIVICLVGKSLIAKATKPQCWSLLPRREEAIQETILSPITPQTVLNRTERCCVALHIYWIVFNLIQNTST